MTSELRDADISLTHDSALSRSVKVSATTLISMGVIEAHPWSTLGQAADVARAAVFLASKDAQWITGIQLAIDGGYIAQEKAFYVSALENSCCQYHL